MVVPRTASSRDTLKLKYQVGRRLGVTICLTAYTVVRSKQLHSIRGHR